MNLDINLFLIIVVLVYLNIRNKETEQNQVIKITLIISVMFYLILSNLDISCSQNIEGWFGESIYNSVKHTATHAYHKAKKTVIKTYHKATKVVKKVEHTVENTASKAIDSADKGIHQINIPIPTLSGKKISFNLGSEIDKLGSEASKTIKDDIHKSVTSIVKISNTVGKNIKSFESHAESVVSKIGNKIKEAEKGVLDNLTNPCWWLNGDICLIGVDSALASLSAVLSKNINSLLLCYF